MKVIKVSITMNNRCVFSGHFTNYPTIGELLLHIPTVLHGADPRALLRVVKPKQWVISYNPYKITQFVWSFGIPVGMVKMEEILVADCVGFNPRKTSNKLGRDAVAEAAGLFA